MHRMTLSMPDAATASAKKSRSKIFDPRVYRARFSFFWARFLRENYRNPEEVAVAFGVRYQTALNWWQGLNRPSGDVVAFAGRQFAEFMESSE